MFLNFEIRFGCQIMADTSSIPECLKKQVKDMLRPYLTGDYGNDVKNPVLLLNFLHQHSLISKPEYHIRDDPQKPFHFIGSCSLGPPNSQDHTAVDAVPAMKVQVEASSKKNCKNEAAQKILNLFLGDETINLMNGNDDHNSQIGSEIHQMSIDESRSFDLDESMEYQSYEDLIKPMESLHTTENFYEDDLTGILMFDDLILDVKTKSKGRKKRKKRSKKSSSAGIVAQPQCAKAVVMNNSAEKSTSAGKGDCNAVLVGSSESSLANPRRRSMSDGDDNTLNIKSAGLSSSRKRNNRPAANKMGSLSSLSSSSSCQSSESSKIHSSESVPGAVSHSIYFDFFDPFSRQRPKIVGYESIAQTKDAVTGEKEDKCVHNGITESQVNFPSQHTKTPFQILQEKAVRNYKLIPRSRINKTDHGFSCTLVLDTNSGYGEGRTKKEAKVKAATDLLALLENAGKSALSVDQS